MTAISHRAFEPYTDSQPITQFLLDTYTRYGQLFNWEPRRWLGTLYHNDNKTMIRKHRELSHTVRIWEDSRQQIIGVVIPEGTGDVFLQIHPDHRRIEDDMLTWITDNLPRKRDDDGRDCLDVHADAGDTHREALLIQHGYQQTEMHENIYRRAMSEPIPDVTLPEGYRVRTMRRHPDDQEALATLLNTAFKRSFHSAEEYRNFQASPHYEPELDIVIEASDGTLVTNAGFAAHREESFALIEPVCTHPEHQGRNLARAAIAEGLRRVQARGIQTTHIGAWYANPVANHVYQSMGFTDDVRLCVWRRWD